MSTPDSQAERDLLRARQIQKNAVLDTLSQRTRWVVAGTAVFAISAAGQWGPPGASQLLILVLTICGLLLVLLGRHPRSAPLVGKRAQLSRAPARSVRWFLFATITVTVALEFLLNTSAVILAALLDDLHLFREFSITGGLIQGLVLATLGPRFARWWFRHSVVED